MPSGIPSGNRASRGGAGLRMNRDPPGMQLRIYGSGFIFNSSLSFASLIKRAVFAESEVVMSPQFTFRNLNCLIFGNQISGNNHSRDIFPTLRVELPGGRCMFDLNSFRSLTASSFASTKSSVQPKIFLMQLEPPKDTNSKMLIFHSHKGKGLDIKSIVYIIK